MNKQVLTAVISSVGTLAVSWWAFATFARPNHNVVTIDNRAMIAELLRLRQREGPPLPVDTSSYPPPLAREPLDLATAQVFFPLAGLNRPYYPSFYYARPVDTVLQIAFPEHASGKYEIRTNSQGFRHAEFLEDPPDLRILITGDSHIDGVCENDESVAAVLQMMIAHTRSEDVIECANLGVGGYHAYNYLGVLEHFRYLRPDFFVMVVYGGNDFYGMMSLQRYFAKRPPAEMNITPEGLGELESADMATMAQDLQQVFYFKANPEDVQPAIDTMASITDTMRSACSEMGTSLICVYLPPQSSGQPELRARSFERLLSRGGITREEAGVSDRMADQYLAFCRLRNIPMIDLRPIFREQAKPLYYRADGHINPRANIVIATALSSMVKAISR